MKEATVEKANGLIKEINFCRENLKKTEWIRLESVVTRETTMDFNSFDEPLVIPKELFKTVGKLIQVEYLLKLNFLEKELEKLQDD